MIQKKRKQRNEVIDKLKALITSLFGANEQGAFYIPRPVVNGTQALFQDAAGTTPVTADGDPVGLMIDQSANGNHATQSVSGNRPVYRTDEKLHWLEFYGVDDSFVYPTSTTSTSHTVAVAHSPDEISGDLKYFLDADGSGRLIFAHLDTTGGKIGIYDGVWREAGNAALGAQVVTYDANGSQSDLGIYRNNLLIGTRLAYSPVAISPPSRLMSKFSDNENSYAGKIYGIVIVHNTISTSQRGDLNSYLEGLGGV
jgi:hypothetical protein